MHKTPLKTIFTDSTESVGTVAKNLLDVATGEKHITEICDIGAFCDDDEAVNLAWHHLVQNIHYFKDNFFINGEINSWFVMCDYLTDLTLEHKATLETIADLTD